MEVNGYTIEPGANLREADLTGANLAGAMLLAMNFEGPDLEGVYLGGASLDLRASAHGPHWYGTQLFAVGTDQPTGRAQMGHHSATFTANVYGHADPRRAREAGEKVGALLWSR